MKTEETTKFTHYISADGVRIELSMDRIPGNSKSWSTITWCSTKRDVAGSLHSTGNPFQVLMMVISKLGNKFVFIY